MTTNIGINNNYYNIKLQYFLLKDSVSTDIILDELTPTVLLTSLLTVTLNWYTVRGCRLQIVIEV